MDVQYRDNFTSWIDRSAAKFGLAHIVIYVLVLVCVCVCVCVFADWIISHMVHL